MNTEKVLRDRIELLEEELRQLKAGLADPHLPKAFAEALSKQQMAILQGLRRKQVASYEYLDCIAGTVGNSERSDNCGRNRAKTAMLNLRTRLKPFGINISTWRGVGYYLDEQSKARLEQQFAEGESPR